LARAALLLDGTVLVAGCQTTTSEDLDSAEIYDAATNAFARLAAPMGTTRSGHLGVQLLHNGKVLISGGTSGGQLVPSAEVYDPVTGAFQPVDSPGTARRLCHEPHSDGGCLWGLYQQRISDQSRPLGCRRPVPRDRDRPGVQLDGADDVHGSPP